MTLVHDALENSSTNSAMPVLPEVVRRCALATQPLVFETAVKDYPYSTNGSVFLVGYEGGTYVVTTRHGLNPENPPAICVFPTDTSQKILPLGQVFFVPRDYESEDYMDIAIIDVHPSAKGDDELNQARLIDLASAYEADWVSGAEEMSFFVVGYPAERSTISVDAEEIRTDRIVLSGKYGGLSPSPYLHLLKIDDSQNLESYGGFTGGPVSSLRIISDQRVKLALCGMAIRGTRESGVFHFLDASVLMDALKVRLQQDLASESA